MVDHIFYSWQSDSPGSTNRNLISTALEKAIEDLKKDKSVTIDPAVDRDTLGVPGSPDISHSIFGKIDLASVFVCDVSIIEPNVKKPAPNPNVLVELGYAVKVLGWNRIVMIMNTEFGKPAALPFDLRAKRVLTYAVKQSDVEKAPARNSLRKDLVSALKLIFEKEGARRAGFNEPGALDTRPADRELFQALKGTLPSNGSISFINQQNMAGFSWPRHKLDDLRKFYYEWDSAEHEFLDPELEVIREKIHNLIGEYLDNIAINTFPANNPDRQTVPPEWEENDPKHFFDVVQKLHETAGSIVRAHTELIRLARKKLAV